ncbi:MAG: SDR family oxidoreductase [Myxococcota bacterium]|nr:SDR family oxidoreductase [Myxococcota bacterium]
MSNGDRFDSIYRPGLFEGQVFLVTGGGTGIGRCIAHELASLGATAVLAGRREEPLQQVVKELAEADGRGDHVVLNIRDPEAVDTAVAALVAKHGRLDGVVNNAGGQFPVEAGDLKPKGWMAVVDTNLNGTWWVSQAAYRHAFRENGGAIVNMVADVWVGAPGMVHTGAARAGVMNMTVTLAAEWASEGVRVNAVAPGPILSGGLAKYPEAIQRQALDEVCVTPPSRFGTESEVSAAVVFLLSPAAAYVSGETMKVDGATSVHKNTMVPVGHHDGTPKWDGFHLRAELGGLYAREIPDPD